MTAALLLGLIATAAAFAFAYREDVAHALITAGLARTGVSGATFRVERIDGGEVRIADFRADASLRFDRLAIRYSLAALIEGRIERIALGGLHLDLTDPDRAAGVLLRGERRGGGGPLRLPSRLPAVAIRDARLRTMAGGAVVSLRVDGDLAPVEDRRMSARLRLAAETPFGPVRATVAADLRTEPGITALAEIGLAADALDLGGLRLVRARAMLPLELGLSQRGATARVVRAGNFAFDGASDPATGWTLGALSIALPPAAEPQLRLDFSAAAGATLSHALRLEPSAVRLVRAGGAGGATQADIGVSAIDAAGALAPDGGYDGRIDLPAVKLSARGQAVAASGASIRLSLPGGGKPATARIDVAELRHAADRPVLSPLAMTLDARLAGNDVRFTASASIKSAPVTLSLTGRHDLAKRTGRAKAALGGLDFDPARLQPGAVVPALADMKKVTGGIAASAALRWADGTLDGTARIALRRLAGEIGTIAFAGLDGAVSFDRLNPPATPPGQRLSLERIATGPTAGAARLAFALRPTGEIHIERLEADIAEGRLTVADAVIDPKREVNRAEIGVSGVRIDKLLGLIDLADVSATGLLSGRIPLVFTGGALAVEGGQLAADGEGMLRFRSKEAGRVLQGGGDQVDLLLRALEDFRYRRLSVDLDKAAGGQSRVALHLAGQNPAVRDGQPFEININLETNLDRILNAVGEWYRLSGRTLSDIVGGSQRRRTP